MRWPRTLSLYVTREVATYTSIGLAAITILMLARSLVRVLDELVGAGVIGMDLLRVVALLAAMLGIYALPVSFLFGVLLAIGRMAGDVEIVAMRACGLGLRGLLTPIAILGAVLSLSTLALCVEVEPAARRQMATAVRTMVMRGASVEPGRFNTVGDRTLYVDERIGPNQLRGILISDRTDPKRPFLVFAEAGDMRFDEEHAELQLTLERGDVHLDSNDAEEDGDKYRRMSFERLEYKIDVAHMLNPNQPRRAREMPVAELRDVIDRIASGDPGPLREEPRAYATNLERRYALPAAPALFALVGVPLGMQRKRGARSYGVILCAVLAFGYYALVSFCESLAVGKGFPPRLAMWLPNLAFGVTGLALLVRARRSG
jgi:lipopolysaccharide export system permease protein